VGERRGEREGRKKFKTERGKKGFHQAACCDKNVRHGGGGSVQGGRKGGAKAPEKRMGRANAIYRCPLGRCIKRWCGVAGGGESEKEKVQCLGKEKKLQKREIPNVYLSGLHGEEVDGGEMKGKNGLQEGKETSCVHRERGGNQCGDIKD